MRAFALIPALALAALILPGPAAAKQVCVEELSGVCLKYEEVPDDPAPAAPAAQPQRPAAPPPPEAVAERQLGLSGADRRAVQSGLSALGYYSGGIDGAIGPRSRRAIAAWQRDQGLPANGYLTRDQVGQLVAAGAPRPAPAVAAPAPAPAAEPAPQPAVATPAPPPPPQTDPIVGKSYSHKTEKSEYIFTVDLEVTAPNEGVMKVYIFTAQAVSPVSKTCEVKLDRPFKCVAVYYIPQAGSSNAEFTGTLPNVALRSLNLYENISESLTLW